MPYGGPAPRKFVRLCPQDGGLRRATNSQNSPGEVRLCPIQDGGQRRVTNSKFSPGAFTPQFLRVQVRIPLFFNFGPGGIALKLPEVIPLLLPVLPVPEFEKDFLLVTDVNYIAVSAMLNRKLNGILTSVAFYSKLLWPAERRYSTYYKECLAIVFGCERARSYFEHKEFYLHCENLDLCWLFRNVKGVGRLGRWILRLAPFKFKVHHTKGADNVVAGSFSQMFEGRDVTDQGEEFWLLFKGCF